MATSIGELSLKISGDAQPVLGTMDSVRNSVGKLSKEAPKLSGAFLRRAFGGLGGDIGGKFAEDFSGSFLGGLGIGAGLGGLVSAGVSLIGKAVESIGAELSDLFSGEGARLFAEEMKTSAEWMGQLGRNAGTTQSIVDNLAKSGGRFAEEFQKITDLSRNGTIERTTFSNSLFGGLGRQELSGRDALDQLRQEAERQRGVAQLVGGRGGAELASSARQQLELIERARVRDERIANANRLSNPLERNLGIASARQQFDNPLGGDELARRAIDEAAILARTVGMTADEAARYRLELAGATPELRNQLREMQRTGEGRRLTEEFLSPIDKFKKEIANIESLLKEGRIDSDTAALATERALRGLGGPTELRASGALLAGSQEALSAITRNQLQGIRPRRSAEEILDFANRQRQEQLEEARRLRAEVRTANARPPVTVVEARI